MSDILIKNMEMPKGNNVLVVDSAGTITKVNRWTGAVEATDPLSVEAVALPEHGRLKDYDKIKEVLTKNFDVHADSLVYYILSLIDETDTVVEAST